MRGKNQIVRVDARQNLERRYRILEDFQTPGSTYKRLNFFKNFKDMELDGPGIFTSITSNLALSELGKSMAGAEKASLGICWDTINTPSSTFRDCLTEKPTTNPTFPKSPTSLKATAPQNTKTPKYQNT